MLHTGRNLTQYNIVRVFYIRIYEFFYLAFLWVATTKTALTNFGFQLMALEGMHYKIKYILWVMIRVAITKMQVAVFYHYHIKTFFTQIKIAYFFV